MDDPLRTIGSGGKAGRGNNSTSPSAAARNLAGGSARKKPTKVAKPHKESAPEPEPEVIAEPVAEDTANRRLRAVTDEEVAAAAAAAEAAAAAAEAAREAGEKAVQFSYEELFDLLNAGAQRVFGDDWEEKLIQTLGVLRQRLGGRYEIDEFGLDPQFTEMLYSVVQPLAEKWFRLEVRGVENIPGDGGALLVANHSGTIPVDGLVTGYAVNEYANRTIRPLGADLVFSLPFVGSVARKFGATLACADDAERLLTQGELAAVWPEGFKGVGKPFSERYKLQRFGRGGFVSAAMRAQVPIIPVSIVGAEEIYPLVGNVPTLARILGLPYLPITPFFPLLGPLGMIPLPSKWIIEFGEPIRTDAYPPDAADDPMLLFNVTDQVRETIQQTLYSLLIERGNPFI